MKIINNSGFKKKGISLIELIISMAILLLILSFVAGFYIYNLKAFQNSDKLSQVQFDVRMAGDYITSELRNVNTISSSDTALPFSLNLSLISAKYPTVSNVSFVVENAGSHYLVRYTITSNFKDAKGLNKQYKLESKVLLNNVTSSTDVGTSLGTIYYKKQFIS